MSVDALLELVRSRGLKLSNLFQLSDERWQANVSDGQRFWEFGRGDSPSQALMAALHMAATTESEQYVPREIKHTAKSIVTKPSMKI